MEIDYDKIESYIEKYAVRGLELYFNSVFRRMVSYKIRYRDMLIVNTEDGECYIYDTMTCSIRKLPDSSNLTKDSFSREFGHRIEYLLRLRGMGKQELAEALNMDTAQLSRYLNGKSTPSFYIVDKIARVLNCTTEELRHLD